MNQATWQQTCSKSRRISENLSSIATIPQRQFGKANIVAYTKSKFADGRVNGLYELRTGARKLAFQQSNVLLWYLQIKDVQLMVLGSRVTLSVEYKMRVVWQLVVIVTLNTQLRRRMC